jgi:ferrochelatase
MSEKAKKSVKKTSKVSAKAAPKAKGEKVAVVMFNLGGPDSPQAVRPFLMNFFMDRNIISLPVPFRCLIAWLIAKKRSRAEAKDSYDELGGSSPLLKNTQAQAVALEKELKASKDGNKYKTFVCMRYWHPMSAQIVREVRDWGADRIVFMPLYPQFSTTTTWSARERWDKDAYEAGYTDIPSSMVCCYPTEKGFIEACAENIYAQYQAAVKDKQENIRILLSAHGLPEDIVENGDPYQWQCEQTAEAIIAQMEKKYKLKSLDYVVCYQSRVGPKKWIGPSLDEALQQAAHDN